jgi:hypothetical protein
VPAIDEVGSSSGSWQKLKVRKEGLFVEPDVLMNGPWQMVYLPE